MRFLKTKLPLWVAGGLLTSATSATAVEPQFDPSLYTQVAQADVPSVPVPASPTLVPEELYERRALPAAEAAEEAENEPTRYLQSEFLENRGIATYGWIDAGIGANAWGAPWNGPITFNDRAWQGMMNQLYLVNEKTLGEDLGWGGRVDLLYGTDYVYTTAQGLDAFGGEPNSLGLSGPRWGSSRYYGLAMPQLYGELGREDLGVKFGHFYTLIGYEVVPAIGNFFYTHAYTMQYGEPFTHTGVLGTWVPNDQVGIVAGITNGWDNWDNSWNSGLVGNPGYPGFNNNAAFLGAVTFTSSDESQALILANSSGNEIGDVVNNLVGNRSITSIVYTNELSDRLNYVYQSDIGYQFNANPVYQTFGQQNGTAFWYGVNQYVFWNFTDTLIGGMRLEWFRDNNGTRVVSNVRNLVMGGTPANSGFAGNFWAMTWGLNYLMGNNVIIRPELRYDWFSADAGGQVANGGILPYGNADRSSQFYGGCDVIWQF